TIENSNCIQFSQGKTTITTPTFIINQILLIAASKASNVTQTYEITNLTDLERNIDCNRNTVTDANVTCIKTHRSNSDVTYNTIGTESPAISGFSDYLGEKNQIDVSHKITFLDSNYNESPFSNTITSKTQLLTDEAFLDMIQEANFRYYWDGAEPNSGLAYENIPGRTSMIATGASGFGMMAIIAGVERGFITRDDAVERFIKITKYLNKADRFHGVFPHFLDGVTGKVVPFFGKRDNGGDLVEHSFLMQGLLTAH